MDKNSGELFVLEVNAQCGLSDDENYTSIGAILRLSHQTYTGLIKNIILNAMSRSNSMATKEISKITV